MALHIMAVVTAFGVTFAYPVIFAVGAKTQPRAMPLLHRIEYTIERWLVNPSLLVVFAAGIFLASDGHHWSEFFVQWGFAVVIVIGALVGSVMIPTSKKAEQAAERDIAAAGDGEVVFGEDYRGLVRRLNLVGTTLSALVLLTIVFMVVKP
ncbi:MAG TPA: DUF2269 family protein [Solirubrobacteraceae bacterium]|nr:DUF2269 family protein [Solirubrobacteraceae bacterium]